ncbi:MAG: sulfatase-like hydrolase/transferase, partial [Gammaproteobacteria bacterium]|nr:sulfatase-like hydrolase/transferase [Gemmatimonadota bacterium]NIU75381.1 sulfatase-like hydrolase/transferase [Gammaproteobacteria bacterium]
AAGLADRTLWIITSDHGELLGERGLWYKMHFFEDAVRVPLVMAGPGVPVGRIAADVSLVDLLPTLLDYGSDGAPPELASAVDGRSLLPLATGGARTAARPVIAEYLAEGAVAPMLMIKQGALKRVTCAADPTLLFDLEADPLELENVAGRPERAADEAGLDAIAQGHWDGEAVREAVIASQRRRRTAHAALMTGASQSWDYQPWRDASRQYNRNTGGEMYDTDRRARIPYRDPPAPDGGEAE